MKKPENNITIATYNIQITNNPNQIVKNIKKMRDEGVALFCLQEVRELPGKEFIGTTIEQILGKNFKAEYFLDSFGLAIFWNATIFTIQDIKKLFLPQLEKKSASERVVDWIIRNKEKAVQRKALVCTFTVYNKPFRISNIHLDWQQGPNQRSIQLKTLLDHLHSKQDVKYECLCGDFNTTHVLKKNKEQFRLDELFHGEYKDITRNISWTIDWHNSNYVAPISFIMRKFHIHYYQKLDYIWVKNLTALNVETINMDGSDHLPVVATLEMKE